MQLTLADKVTLSRLVLAPLIVASYLWLPIEHSLCFWIAGWLCAIAEYTDFVDGRIARLRGEVSDFGKLADPFCDVLYRIPVLMALVLPAGGVGYIVSIDSQPLVTARGNSSALYDVIPIADLAYMQPVYALTDGTTVFFGAGIVPWLPVLLMVVREIVAGALRAMAATRGVVLAARSSGKLKAWLQGVTIVTLMAFPACFWQRSSWHLTYAFWATWICAVVSIYSIIEYIWINRRVLAGMAVRRSE
ncbi:MAG: CDP-alcohol phosphatidyltransferase family protein [Planctomycetes bacterium]|nr:CDP-alcohol phosphatidyltransferase family protein [Planctomycetota bacterium]